jgi:hypothetical protein
MEDWPRHVAVKFTALEVILNPQNVTDTSYYGAIMKYLQKPETLSLA